MLRWKTKGSQGLSPSYLGLEDACPCCKPERKLKAITKFKAWPKIAPKKGALSATRLLGGCVPAPLRPAPIESSQRSHSSRLCPCTGWGWRGRVGGVPQGCHSGFRVPSVVGSRDVRALTPWTGRVGGAKPRLLSSILWLHPRPRVCELLPRPPKGPQDLREIQQGLKGEICSTKCFMLGMEISLCKVQSFSNLAAEPRLGSLDPGSKCVIKSRAPR